MKVKDIIEELKKHDKELDVWFFHKLKGKVMPEEIAKIISKVELTADGILLS